MKMLVRVGKAARVLAVWSSHRCFPIEFKGLKVTEAARISTRTEARRCYRGLEHYPKESKTAPVLAVASSRRCFPTKFKGSEVTDKWTKLPRKGSWSM